MDMEIRLGPSRMLAILLVMGVVLACGAIAMSMLPLAIKLLIMLVSVRLSWLHWHGHLQVTGLCLRSLSGKRAIADDNGHGQTAGIVGVVSLADGRLVEAVLRSMYCLWWLQVLVLQSHDKTRTVVVMPDSSSRQQRRLLRKLSAA